MPHPNRILSVIGTRPEAIKMAPVVHALREAGWATPRVLVTGQHRDLVAPQLRFFGVDVDRDLEIARPGQGLNGLAAALLSGLDEALRDERPDLVLAQGDTTTVMATATACHHLRVPFAHVEAGLRTGDMENPFPEEMNRALADRLATLRFAPTEGAADNLAREGIRDGVHVTGNTVVDALLWARERVTTASTDAPSGRRRVLVTAHRRESFGPRLASICSGLRAIADRGDVELLFPVHPNPNVTKAVRAALADHPAIQLTAPLDYPELVRALMACHVVLTDSGGLQEEAPSLGKPVLVMRDTTERTEGIEAGTARLVGTRSEDLLAAAAQLLDNPAAYDAMARVENPYGDGDASGRVVAACRAFLGC